MNILVFGASGGTGRQIVAHAVEAGHTVTAFVRDPATIANSGQVRVAQGDVRDAAAVAAAIAGEDAILSALGSRSLAKNDLLDRASENILAGMHAHGVRRLIVLGAAGALHDPGKYSSLWSRIGLRLLKATLLRNTMRDSAAQERRVEASDVDYTIVLPPELVDGASRGSYRVQLDGLPPGGRKIARADVAAFMVAQLTETRYLRKSPYLAY